MPFIGLRVDAFVLAAHGIETDGQPRMAAAAAVNAA
jgi:hypothetical protein